MPPNPFTPHRLSAVGAAAVVAVSTLAAGALAGTDDADPGAASTPTAPPVEGSDEDFFDPSPGTGGDDREAEHEQSRSEAERNTEGSAPTTGGQGDTAHEPGAEPETGEPSTESPEPETQEPSAPESPEPETQEPSAPESPEPEPEEPSAPESPEPEPEEPSAPESPEPEEPSTESPEPAPEEPSAPSSGGRTASEPDGSAQEIALEMVLDQGWGADEFHNCLEPLWEKESNWNHTAENPSTGAYGIPQSLPGDRMASHGDDWRTNPATQISWGLSYIKDRHGSPCEAWSHSQSNNWY